MLKNQDCINDIYFEELHIRHINLIIDLKNNKYHNWFYKMAIINTLDELKIFISNLDEIKTKCIIAIQKNKIIGFLYTYPLNDKKTCVQINTPIIIDNDFSSNQRSLILELIKKSISKTDLKTSSWIINSEINNTELISCARELGFQPLKEIKLWSKSSQHKSTINLNTLNNFSQINKENIQKVLNFVRSNESGLMRNIYDFNQNDIAKRKDKFCGSIIINNVIIFTILKDLNYLDENVYSLHRGAFWDSRITSTLKDLIQIIFKDNPSAVLKTDFNDKELNSFLNDFEFIELRSELLLIRNNLIKREIKSSNKINNSIESILQKINPQGNAYPSPFPFL